MSSPVLLMMRALHQRNTSVDDVTMVRVELLQTISNHRPQVIGDFDTLPFNVQFHRLLLH